MRQLIYADNLGLIYMRQVALDDTYSHLGVSRGLVDNRTFYSNKGIPNVAPLYYYPFNEDGKTKSWLDKSDYLPDNLNSNRTPNLSPTFIADLEAKLGLTFQSIQRAVEAGEFGPEDVFHYIYAILHSPTYRKRYAEFLKIDFPRVPLTGDPALFWAAGALGRELVALHLLESPAVHTPITRYPVPGDNRVEKGYPKYTIETGFGEREFAPENPVSNDSAATESETGFSRKNPVSKGGRVHINQTQYFDGVPQDVWAFHVGGYQVLDKWLKDRRGRQLSYDDLTHYQRVVVALRRTMALMEEIDATIPNWPIG